MPRERNGGQAQRGGELTPRREAIHAAATAVFFEHGFEAATTLELASRARASKRALYELFGSKDLLLSALIRESSQKMRAPPGLASSDSQGALLGALGQFGHRLLEQLFHPHRIAMYGLAIAEALRSGKVANELNAVGRQPVVDALTRHLEQAARTGFVRTQDVDS